MSGQIRKVREAITEVYYALRGTRGGGGSCISISITAEFIRCP